MNGLLNFIRNQWHPLYQLRKNRIWRAIQRYLDPDISIRICKTWVSVKLLRDLSLFFPHDGNEPTSMLSFRNIIKDQSIEVFFDIGANLGQYTWNALDVGVKMAFLFEPDTTNQRLIFKTIHKNKISNSYLWPIALGEQVVLSEFIVDDASGSVGSIDTLFNSDSLHSCFAT